MIDLSHFDKKIYNLDDGAED